MNAIKNAVQQVVAVTDNMVKSPGALIWWRLGGTISYEKLLDAWTQAGLDPDLLSDSCGPKKALRRAVDCQLDKGHLRRKAPKGGWLIKGETVDMERNDTDIRTECKVYLDAVGRLTCEPADHPLAEDIRASYDRALSTITSQDVTSLLTDLIDHSRGVALREGGGIYFLMPDRLTEFMAMKKVIESISAHRIYTVPAMRSQDIVDGVLAGVEEEASAAADKLDKALARSGDDALGARALKTKASECESMLDKLTGYEASMGVKLDGIRKRLDDLRANVAQAILASEEDD